MHCTSFRSTIFLFSVFFVCLSLAVLRFPCHNAHAASKSVTISPTKVFFTGRDRATIVRLVNPTDQETTYRLSLVPIRIDEHGKSFREFSANEWEILSQRLIRFSPRKVTIPAKGWQTVRLMVRKPADLPPGEYRTHLQVMPLADNTPLAENTQPTVKHTTAQIDMHISVTIPIIIRHQETNVTITPLAAKLSTDNRATTLQLTLQRNGNQSTAMRIEVYNTDANGQQQKITGSQGIHFYNPIPLGFSAFPFQKLSNSVLICRPSRFSSRIISTPTTLF